MRAGEPKSLHTPPDSASGQELLKVAQAKTLTPPVTPKYRWWQRVAGVLRMTHLLPNLVVLTATLVLGIVASQGQVELGRLGRVWLVVLCGHSSIGLSNDYVDRQRDVLAQAYKPLALGLVSVSFTRYLISSLVLVELGVVLTLGVGPTLLALVATASGWLYNFYLKDSYLSWVPYLLSFTTLPLFIWAGLGHFEARLVWMYPPALLLLSGVNLANSVPDIITDLGIHSSHGLGPLLGQRRALWVSWLLIGSAPLLCLVLTPWVTYKHYIFWPSAVLAISVVLLSIIVSRLRPGRVGLVLNWQLMMLASFSTGVGWLAAIML